MGINYKKLKEPVVSSGLAVVLLCGTIFGYGTGMNQASINALFDSPQSKTVFSASVVLGAFLSCFVAGYLADLIGRKKMLMIGAVIGLIGNIIHTAVSGVWVTSLGRLLFGFSVGICSSIGPLYLSETAPNDLRGPLGTAFQFSITFSIFIASITVYIKDWRIIAGILFVPLAVLAIVSFFIPESPRYLAGKKDDDALKLLTAVFDEEEGKKQLETIKEKKKIKVTWGQIFAVQNRMPLIIAVMLAIGQQMTGINVIIYYFTIIIGGKLGNKADPAFIGLMLWNCVASMFSIVLIARLGRRTLMIVGQSIMLVSLVIAGICTFYPVVYYLNIVAMCLFIGGFEISVGPLFFVVINEIFEENLRSKVGAMMTSVQWLLNLTLTLSAIKLIGVFNKAYGNDNNGLMFFFFMGFSVLTLVFTVLYLPETRGKSFEEINQLMRQGGMVYGRKTEK